MWRYIFFNIIIAASVSAENAEMTFSEAYQLYKSAASEGNLVKALPYAKIAYELGDKSLGPNHENTARLALNYGQALLKADNKKEASQILEIAQKGYEKNYGRNSLELIDPLMMRGHAAATPNPRAQGTKQRRFYDKAIKLAKREGDRRLLANLNYDAGVRLTDEAKSLGGYKYLKTAHALYNEELGANHLRTAMAAYYLAMVEMGRRKNDNAKVLFYQVVDALDPGHSTALRSHIFLVTLHEQDGDASGIIESCRAVSHLPIWNQICK